MLLFSKAKTKLIDLFEAITKLVKFSLDWLGDRSLSWWYATIQTALLAVVGVMGNLYTDAIKSTIPFSLDVKFGTLNGPATFFWAAVWLTTGAFAIRQAYSDKVQRDTIKSFEDLIRTTPSSDFLIDYGDISTLAMRSSATVLGNDPTVTVDQIKSSARIVLESIASAAKEYDEADASIPYCANVMQFVDLVSADAALRTHFNTSLDRALPDSEIKGFLYLRKDLSANTAIPGSEDTALQSLTLVIPKITRPPVLGVRKWLVLPGAPYAFVNDTTSYFSDTDDIGKWIIEYSHFTDPERAAVESYFDAQRPHICSFYSMPIYREDPASGRKLIVGILNVHRNAPGILRGNDDAAKMFLLITTPLINLLSDYLQKLEDLGCPYG